MKKVLTYISIALMFGITFVECGKSGGKLTNDTDSLSYIVGLNVGRNLIAMDSTLNINAVCAAIRDVYNGTQRMSLEEGRNYYLAQKTYFVHEKAQAYQEQFLIDLSKTDRSFVRARNGVTYKIVTLGDQSVQSMSARDTVRISFTIRDEFGEIVCEQDTLRSAYRDLIPGLQEIIKVTGRGGKVNAWLPSKTAYDTAGNNELNIRPDQLLNYEVDILDIDFYNRNRK